MFLKCNLPVMYYGYTTEIVSICISNALVMFQNVMFSVAHSRVKGNTTFLSYCYSTIVIQELGKNKAIQLWSYMDKNVFIWVQRANFNIDHIMFVSIGPEY
jgi:hypothetical protein